MTKPKYATAEERRAALSRKARQQMLEQWAQKQEIPGYFGRHRRVRVARGPAKHQVCAWCGASARHWAQIHGTDGVNPAHYQPMCYPCHWAYDEIGKRSKASQTREQLSATARKAWITKKAKANVAVGSSCDRSGTPLPIDGL